MINAWRTALAGLLIAALLGCSPSRESDYKKWMKQDGRIKVLSTIAMIDDLVREVGGERVSSLTLIQGGLDPHTYQLVKGDDEKLARADLIFYNGLGLEHGPSLREFLKESRKAHGIADSVKEQYPERILYYDGQPDPHIWMDISLWSKTVPAIVEGLSQMDPGHASFYRENGKNLQKKLEKANEEVAAIVREVSDDKRYLVTSHDAFNYFARAYLAAPAEKNGSGEWQIRFQAPEGLAPESQLSTSDIQEIIDHLQKYEVNVLFPESNVSKDSIRKIVDAGREKGLTLRISSTPLYGDSMGVEGSDGDTYIKMILHNASVIRNDLLKEDQ